LDADALLPISGKGSGLTYVIAISRSDDQRAFLASEVSFLYRLMCQLSLRLEMIRAEREKDERERHEALLVHQSTEAELRALRAQIDPHFLFNALNTIADLIVVNPNEAERLTEKLAEVFRHVLTNSQKSTITLREEIEFVRRYLEIEEARYRNRLEVRIDVDSEAAGVKVPSLILQPLVDSIDFQMSELEQALPAELFAREPGCPRSRF
jgi:two-component system, LytTR family, sensor kinase